MSPEILDTHRPALGMRLVLATSVLLLATGGCGSDLSAVLVNSAGAAGRTALDLALTELVNDLANAADPIDDGPDEPGVGSPTPPPGLVGALADGQALFARSFCPSCHCPTATGGCSLNAPNLSGKPYETIHDRLRGNVAHPGGKFPFGDQDILDLEAFLATVAPPDAGG